jgi:acetyl esterase
MPVDPGLLTAYARLGVVPPAESADPVEQRRLAYEFEAAVYPACGPAAPDVRVTDHLVPVPGHPDVPVRLFHPEEPTGPACLFLFGGAWQQGGLHHPSVGAVCALRAQRAGVVVAAVSYGLAPEHPFPTALEQAYAALGWLVGRPDVDPGRVAVSGQSSGGNLTAALTLLNRERDDHPIARQILEVPALDLTLGHLDSAALGVPDEQLAGLDAIVARYVGGAERTDPLVSPLLATDLSGLPPALVVTAEMDPLRGDGEAYVAALAAAGVPTAGVRLLGATHESVVFERVLPAARVGQAAVTDALRSLHD